MGSPVQNWQAAYTAAINSGSTPAQATAYATVTTGTDQQGTIVTNPVSSPANPTSPAPSTAPSGAIVSTAPTTLQGLANQLIGQNNAATSAINNTQGTNLPTIAPVTAPTPAASASGGPAVNPGNYSAPFYSSTIGYGQNPTGGPSITGQGLFQAQPYAINDEAITGAPTQGASSDYGLNEIWSNLDAALQANQINNYSASAPTTTAAQAQYAQAGPTQISTAGALPLQTQQAGLADTLNTQATGGGVSPADLQLEQGSQENLAAQLSALGSQRGGGSGNPALAARAAADAAAASGANLNSQMGIQRAQETLSAQQAENNVLSSGVGEAQNYNTQQADLSQANSEYNASNAQATQIANLGANQQTNLANESAAASQTLANQQAAEAAQTQYNQQLLALSGAETGIGESQQSAALANQQLQVNQQENVNQTNEAGYANAAQANAGVLSTAAGTIGGLSAALLPALKGAGASGTTSTSDATPSGSAAATYNPNQNQPNGFDDGTSGDSSTSTSSSSNDTSGFGDFSLGSGDEELSSFNFPGSSSTSTGASNTTSPTSPSTLAAYQALTGQSPPAAPAAQASGPSAPAGGQTTQSYTQAFPGSSSPYPTGNATAVAPYDPNYGQPMPGYGASPTFGGTYSAGGFPGTAGGQGGAQGWGTVGTAAPITSGQPAPGYADPNLGSLGNGFSLIPTTAYQPLPQSNSTAPLMNGTSNPQASTAVQAIANAGINPAVTPLPQSNSTSPLFATPVNAPTPVNANVGPDLGAIANAGIVAPPPASETIQGATPLAQTSAPLAVGNSNAQAATALSAIANAGIVAPGQTTPAASTFKPTTQAGVFHSISDQNVKTGIEGGNPMLQSFLDQYDQDKARAPDALATQDYQGPRQITKGTTTPGTTGYDSSGAAAQTGAGWGGEIGGIFGPMGSAAGQIFGGALGGIFGGGSGTPAKTTPGTTLPASGYTQDTVDPEQQNLYGTTSDEDAKTDIADPDDDEVQAFLDSVHAHQYRYKNPNAPGAGHGTFVSPMAQEIEKTDLGKNFVFTQPNGVKGVDYGKAFGTLMASQAMLNERLNDHDQMLRGRR